MVSLQLLCIRLRKDHIGQNEKGSQIGQLFSIYLNERSPKMSHRIQNGASGTLNLFFIDNCDCKDQSLAYKNRRKEKKAPDGRILPSEIAGEPDIERYNALKIADLFWSELDRQSCKVVRPSDARAF